MKTASPNLCAAPGWCDETFDAHARRQLAPGWCVPACIALLFDAGSARGERAAAHALGLDVPQPHALDLRDESAYARLRSLLQRRGMCEVFAPGDGALLSYEVLRSLRRRLLVSVGYHAVICSGVAAADDAREQPAWRVLDPRNGRVGWRALPTCGLAAQFAFG